MEFLVIFVICLIGYLLFKYCYTASTETDTSSYVEIKTLVSEVKKQLTELDEERKSKNELALFQLDNFELELTFIVKNTSELKTGSDFKLIAIDVNSSSETQNVQKLKIKWNATNLSPVTERGDDLPLNEF